MSQLLIAYWVFTGIGFLYIVGSAALGHLHGGEEGGDDPGDVDGSADGGDPGDVDGSADGGDPGDADGNADGDDPGDVDAQSAGARLIVRGDSAAGVISTRQQDRTVGISLKLLGLLSPTKMALFFFFFGAVGVVTLHLFPIIGHLSLIPAVAIGYMLRRMMLTALSKFASKMHTSTNFKQESLIGSVGKLTLSIEPGLTGEIMVSTRGSRHSAPARAKDPEVAIKNLSNVIITDYRDGIFFVEPQEIE